MDKFPMTKNGVEKLTEELNHLKYKERPRIIASIATARAHGDLKENAEYHAAREQQSFAEGRIREIEGKLASAQVIDISKLTNEGRVVFGATVNVILLTDNTEMTFQIVGEDEANIKQQKLSYSSPIGRALIGKEEGDVVTIQTPGGIVEYEIVEVHYI